MWSATAGSLSLFHERGGAEEGGCGEGCESLCAEMLRPKLMTFGDSVDDPLRWHWEHDVVKDPALPGLVVIQ